MSVFPWWAWAVLIPLGGYGAYQAGLIVHCAVRLRRRRALVWVTAYIEDEQPRGAYHEPDCLVARHPDYRTWETSGFPWCTCRRTHG